MRAADEARARVVAEDMMHASEVEEARNVEVTEEEEKKMHAAAAEEEAMRAAEEEEEDARLAAAEEEAKVRAVEEARVRAVEEEEEEEDVSLALWLAAAEEPRPTAAKARAPAAAKARAPVAAKEVVVARPTTARAAKAQAKMLQMRAQYPGVYDRHEE